MIIAATGDVHSPQYYDDFIKAIDTLQVKPNIFFITGDMINRNELQEYEKISNALSGKINCPIVAVFGNNEFIPDITNQIKQKYKEIKFLWDESTVYKIGYNYVGIVGTLGSLDVVTKWQKANIPNIEATYRERVNFVDRHLNRMTNCFRILLMHYAPSYRTLEGENPNFYASNGSRAYENILLKQRPNLVLHGHSHRGKKMAWLETVPIFNVSFPLNKEIVIINTEDLKPGLSKFV